LGGLPHASGQDAQADGDDLPMCEPIRLADLFPELYGESGDEPAGEDGPADPSPGTATDDTTTTTTDDTTTTTTDDTTTTTDDTTTTTDDTTTTTDDTTTTATEPPPASIEEPAPCRPFVYELTFPVLAETSWVSSFGADRSQDRKHKGTDIAAPKLTPIVAAADGWVSWIAEECCAMAVRHTDGWTTWYIHLNNDTYGTDDGMGRGIAPGLAAGAAVEAGQVIAWVGDSGNAEDTVSHLHFELRDSDGRAVDATASLRAASHVELASTTYRAPFADDDGTPHENAVSSLAAVGLLEPCADAPTAFCADQILLGADLAALIDRITGVDLMDWRPARIPEGPWADALLSLAGVLREPTDLCSFEAVCRDRIIGRAQLSLLARLLQRLPADAAAPWTSAPDLGTSVLDHLDGPLNRCAALDDDNAALTRGEMAEILARSLGLIGTPPCDQIE
jgi:hypothetical protein